MNELMGEGSNDSCLLLAVRNGDQQAFEILVGRYNHALLRYAAGIVGEDRAQDLMQVVWIKVWQWSTDNNNHIPGQVKPWLYSITRNYSFNMLRDHKPAVELEENNCISNHDLVHHEVEVRHRTRDLFATLNQLPVRQRQALMMHASGDYSHQQIAAHMQESPHAVRGLIFRARASVRERSLAWAGILPLPFINKWLQKWQQADQLGTAAIAGGAVGGAGGAVVGSSKLASLVAAGTIALGGGAVAVNHHQPVVAEHAAYSAPALLYPAKDVSTTDKPSIIVNQNPVDPADVLVPAVTPSSPDPAEPAAAPEDVLVPAADPADVLVPAATPSPQDPTDPAADTADVLVPAADASPQDPTDPAAAPADVLVPAADASPQDPDNSSGPSAPLLAQPLPQENNQSN